MEPSSSSSPSEPPHSPDRRHDLDMAGYSIVKVHPDGVLSQHTGDRWERKAAFGQVARLYPRGLVPDQRSLAQCRQTGKRVIPETSTVLTASARTAYGVTSIRAERPPQVVHPLASERGLGGYHWGRVS